MDDKDFELLDEASRAVIEEPMRSARYLLWAIILFIGTALIWAYFSELDVRTTAQGKVIPSSHIQKIQHLEGGILSKIYVEEGEDVYLGQTLVKLDDVRFTADYQEDLVRYNALIAKLARLTAESTNRESIDFPTSLIKNYPNLVENEINLFESNKRNHQTTIDTLKRSLEIANERYEISIPLAKEGIISKLEMLNTEKDVNEAKGKLDKEIKAYQQNINEEIVDSKTELDSLKETLEGLQDREKRTTIRSPVDGIVKDIYFDTIGGVVKPAETIMEIVPTDDMLLIEAKVRPEDIAFIHTEQEADIKITAYDSSIYGSLKGTVTHISADAILETNNLGHEISFYKVIIQTKQNYLVFGEQKLPIIPGMQVSADILTGKKTVLMYLLKPILKAKEKALTER